MLAAALFAHDLAAFRVHAAAGLGGDGGRLALLQRPALRVMLMGARAGRAGQRPGCARRAPRLGLWFLVCCSGLGAGDPRGDGQRRAGVPSGEPAEDAPVPGAEFEAGQRSGQDLGPPGGGQAASGGGLDGPARYWRRLGRAAVASCCVPVRPASAAMASSSSALMRACWSAARRARNSATARRCSAWAASWRARAATAGVMTLAGPAAGRPGAAGGCGRRAAPAGMASPG